MASIPEPRPGLVIRYAYLRRHEAAQGRAEGTKDRPCVVVLAVTDDEHYGKTVWVAPITHTPPHRSSSAVEMPATTKDRLGLDPQPSWIVVSEVNRFTWPGPDLRPVAPGRWAYGLLPAGLFRAVCNRLVDSAARGKAVPVQREP